MGTASKILLDFACVVVKFVFWERLILGGRCFLNIVFLLHFVVFLRIDPRG